MRFARRLFSPGCFPGLVGFLLVALFSGRYLDIFYWGLFVWVSTLPGVFLCAPGVCFRGMSSYASAFVVFGWFLVGILPTAGRFRR